MIYSTSSLNQAYENNAVLYG